jgi:hypothetical protein
MEGILGSASSLHDCYYSCGFPAVAHGQSQDGQEVDYDD